MRSALRVPRRADTPAEVRFPEIGERIAGGYRLDSILGEGGMGVVFGAWDEGLAREVAIKMVRPKWLGQPHLRDRFVSEARALARVRHPNVLEVFALGEHERFPYFVMEHIRGRTLDQLLEEGGRGPQPLRRVMPLVERICHGLEAIHRHQLVHGDVKPSNVMLGEGDRLALMDMGLARLLDGPEVRYPGVWGTPAYIAPELAAGRPVPASLLPLADVYSVGILTYELLTGRTPFVTDDSEEMLELHAGAPVPPPRELCPGLPATVEDVLLRALDKDPMRRPQSPDELARSLSAAARASRLRPERLRFLVVDDDHDHRAIVSRILARTFPGSIIESCSDGASALEVVARRVPSLAVVDLGMPRMNGVELTAALKADERAKGMPIVILSGRGSGSDWRLLTRLGADRFVVKPLVPEAFLATVRALLGLEDDAEPE